MIPRPERKSKVSFAPFASFSAGWQKWDCFSLLILELLNKQLSYMCCWTVYNHSILFSHYLVSHDSSAGEWMMKDAVYSETRLTRPRINRKLAQFEPSFMVPAWVTIVCWAYLELLFITRTDKLLLVQSNYLFCGWMCLHSCVTSLISLFSFHTKKNLGNF